MDDILDIKVPIPEESLEKWKQEFKKATRGRGIMNLLQFMECTQCRSRFYAVKLFDTLDVSQKGSISFEEYSRFMHLLASGNYEQLGGFAFSLFDTDKDGFISREELREALQASVEESDTVMTATEVGDLVEVLAKLFTNEGAQRITRERFVNVLRSYPDILGNFTIGDGARAALLSNATTRIIQNRKVWFEKQWRWIEDNPRRAFTNILTVLVIASCFFWRFWRYAGDCSGVDLDYRDPIANVTRREVMDRVNDVYDAHMSETAAKYMAFSLQMMKHDPVHCRDARKRNLLSWTLPVAKGCGQGMKATFTLILIPVSRTLVTRLRKTSLKHVFDFDNSIAYHRMLGKIGFALAWAHTLLHVVDVIRWQDTNLFKQWSFAFPKDKTDLDFNLSAVTNSTPHYRGLPEELLRDHSDQPGLSVLIGSWYGITGIILIVVYSIAALFALDYPKGLAFFNKAPGERENTMTRHRRIAIRIGRLLNNFNYFWYTHQLFALFYLAMLFHPLPHVPDERNEWAWSDSWLWVMVPVFFYGAERIIRGRQSSSMTPVVGLRTLPGKVVEVKVNKPEGLKYRSGQYIFINCFQIAPFEWHPFTLTSAPHEPFLSVHIRAAGDWTNTLYSAVAGYKAFSRSRSDLATRSDTAYPFNIRVAGPYGAPAQNYGDYGVVMCIGAGIGVTPFASILKSVLHTPPSDRKKRLEKVYFHWTVRSRKEASWFKTLIDEIAARDDDRLLDINIHITSLKEGNDLRVMLLRLAEFENIDMEQGSVVSKSVIHFGRPDWSRIFRVVQAEHVDQSRVGVFYCGPSGLKNVLKQECRKRSASRNGPRFIFRKEVF